MALPKQVEEQADLAEELMGQLYPEEPGVGEETPELETEPEPEPEPQPDLEELKAFKERYNTLKGKYDAEVPRLHAELKEFKEKVFQKLEQQIKPAEPEKPETPKVNERLQKFQEEYGEDFVENLRELFRTEVDPLLKERLAPVEEKVVSVQEKQLKAAQDEFRGYLDANVKGDWQKAWNGEDPEFVAFLESPDPSGLYTFGDLVQQYNANWDAERLAKVLNIYLAGKGEPEKELLPPAPEVKDPAQEALIAPSRSTPPPAPKSAEKRIWSLDTIETFKRADRQGKYTPEDSQLMWDDLLTAMTEGRIK